MIRSPALRPFGLKVEEDLESCDACLCAMCRNIERCPAYEGPAIRLVTEAKGGSPEPVYAYPNRCHMVCETDKNGGRGGRHNRVPLFVPPTMEDVGDGVARRHEQAAIDRGKEVCPHFQPELPISDTPKKRVGLMARAIEYAMANGKTAAFTKKKAANG